MLLTRRARAYMNFGRWVADCPQECGNARTLRQGDAAFHCNECGHVASVEWPEDPEAIWQALRKRPANKNRNWFPKEHQLALSSGCPHGQSPADLDEESRVHLGWDDLEERKQDAMSMGRKIVKEWAKDD